MATSEVDEFGFVGGFLPLLCEPVAGDGLPVGISRGIQWDAWLGKRL